VAVVLVCFGEVVVGWRGWGGRGLVLRGPVVGIVLRGGGGAGC
jgi:hypothetical protein